jgi:hypothetical protein
MILDGALMFDNPSSLAIGAGTQASANVIDLVNARNLAVGTEALDILAQVTTTFTSGGAGTLAYSVQGSVDNSAWTTMVTSPTYALANLVAGAQIGLSAVPDLAAGQALPRYLRLLWTVGTAAMTAGAVTAGIVLDRQRNIQYAAGITITN